VSIGRAYLIVDTQTPVVTYGACAAKLFMTVGKVSLGAGTLDRPMLHRRRTAARNAAPPVAPHVLIAIKGNLPVTVGLQLMSDASTASATRVFSARGITKVYEMGEVRVEALRGVDFDLWPGEFVVLLGPSGSGKSTLLNILGGLDVPTAGEVIYSGRNLTTADEATLTAYRRTHVGFVFQFYNLIPSLTARENVALVTELVEHPMTPEDALSLVGLGQRLDHFPAQLSGGEQQRVAIARAIAKQPAVLLCDEPTGALDITTGVVVLEALERVNRELGTATVVITHNAGIAGMADRVVHLTDGRIGGLETNARKIAARELQW
jgi:putative ABC transport system ATP-binding protein